MGCYFFQKLQRRGGSSGDESKAAMYGCKRHLLGGKLWVFRYSHRKTVITVEVNFHLSIRYSVILWPQARVAMATMLYLANWLA